MRINSHTHIFNLRSVLTQYSFDIVARRLVGKDPPSWLEKAVKNFLQDVLLRPENFDEDEVTRKLLASLSDSQDFKDHLARLGEDLPVELQVLGEGSIEELGQDAVRSIIRKVSRLFKRKGDDARKGDLHDLIATLRIGGMPEILDVADEIMEQLEPDDVIVALMMDITEGQDGPEDLEKFEHQLRATAEAAIAYPGRILPFAPLNTQRPDHFEVLQRAVGKMGSVGVKLYPSLGSKVVLAEMDRVYQYCVDNDLPLLMHCSKGGFYAKKEYINYCNPAHWRRVLLKYPDLRICFAHFGGGGAFLRRPIGKTSWASTILDLMERHQGVYADISFHTGLMDGGQGETNYFDNFREFLRHNTYKDRILFGTDYWLVRTRLAEENHWRYFQKKFSKQEFKVISETNPRRFLGLPDDAGRMGKNIERYVRHIVANRDRVGSEPAEWLETAAERLFGEPVAFRIVRRTGQWSANNKAHVRTYHFMKLQQLRKPQKKLSFDEVGQLRMRQMKYWSKEFEAPEIHDRKRTTVAENLNTFLVAAGAVYEPGFDRDKVERRLMALAGDGNLKLADLATSVDRLYRFPSEL